MKKFTRALIGFAGASLLILTSQLAFGFCLTKHRVLINPGVKYFSWGNDSATRTVHYKSFPGDTYGKIAIRCKITSSYNLKVDYKVSQQTFYRSNGKGRLSGTVTTPATIDFIGCQLSGARAYGTKFHFSAPALAPSYGYKVAVDCKNI